MRRLAFVLALLPLAASGGEAGYASRDIELRAEPAAASAVVGRLARGEKFEIVAEQKAWSQVRAGQASGWALSFFVMKGAPAAEVGLGQKLSEVWTLGTERRAETTATIGVRGLDEAELQAAKYDGEALKRLESFAVPAAEAQEFAKKGRLVQQKVDYFKRAQP